MKRKGFYGNSRGPKGERKPGAEAFEKNFPGAFPFAAERDMVFLYMPSVACSLAATAALSAMCTSAQAEILIIGDGGVASTFETAVDEIPGRSPNGR